MEQDKQTAGGRKACTGATEQWTLEGVPLLIRETEENEGGEPNVIVLACRWRYFAGSDLGELKRLASEVDYRVVRVPCSRKVSGEWVAAALDSGADAVMVLGGHTTCPLSGDRTKAEETLKCRVAQDGLDPERMIVDWKGDGTSEGMGVSVDRVIAAVKDPHA